MHSQAGSGVDLDDHAPLFFQRASYVRGHDVDAGNIEADDQRRLDRAGRDLRMNAIGNVGRGAAGAQIRVAANQHMRAGRRNRLGSETLLGKHREGDRVDANIAQRRGVILAALGIAGVLDLDQLGHGMNAVGHDLRRFTASGGNQLATDHEQPVIASRREALDENRRFLGPGGFVGFGHLLATGKVRRDAASLVAVLRFHDHGAADFLGGAQASSASSTVRPAGAGTPTVRSSRRVSSLSWAIVSAMALV